MGYVVIAVVVLLIAVFAGRIIAAGRKTMKRNAAFLASAVASHDLAGGTDVEAAITMVGNASYGVWLDLELSGPREPAFALVLAVKVGDRSLVDGTYPVAFDDEQDAKGLPSGSGVTALNSSSVTTPGKARITTALRALTFDAPAAGGSATVRACLTPGPGVTFKRARLLVTTPASPRDGVSLPSGMRAVG